MIYITEMAFADPSRLAQWHAHYLRNIANLQTVPGFLASQRFEALADTPSPFSALHEIASADVFESAIYKQRGGRASNGDWQNDMINWHRNLYSGLDATPEVANDAYLLFIDEKREVAEREIACRLECTFIGSRWSGSTGPSRIGASPCSTMPRACSRSPRSTCASRCSGRSPGKFGRRKQ